MCCQKQLLKAASVPGLQVVHARLVSVSVRISLCVTSYHVFVNAIHAQKYDQIGNIYMLL